jgi:hypothetical protein
MLHLHQARGPGRKVGQMARLREENRGSLDRRA